MVARRLRTNEPGLSATMQNAIAPVTPATPSSPVESRPSPRAPNAHAFATLLRQSQNPAPAPAKAAPVPLATIDGTIGASAPSAPAKAASAAATSAADAARADDARADAASAESRTADTHTDDSDAATTRADKDDTPTTDGTGMPLSHGLVATHRLAAATVEKGVSDNAERATRISTTSLGARADAGAAATSSNPPSTSLAPRGADTTRQDEPGSIARFAAGTGDKIAIPGAGTSPEIGKTMPFAQSALRTEAMPAPTGLSTLDPAQSGPTSSVDATVATPPTSPDFAQAFAVQVSVLVQDGVHSAELHLNPVETGPVSVRIVVEGSQARIDFGADALATRQAIEAGLPELASALRDAGFTLQGGGVSQHARDPNGDAGSGGGSAARRGPLDSDDTRAAPVSRQRIATAGGVDLYA